MRLKSKAMPGNATHHFQTLVCSASGVRSAFSNHRGLALWWRLVLWLHGKPVMRNLPDERYVECVARGFTFYALLYRCLAVLFLASGLGLLSLRPVYGGTAAYWPAVSLVAAGYLWIAGGLARRGAASFRRGDDVATTELAVFIVMVIAFLSMFLGGASVSAYHLGWLTTWQNVLAGIAFLALGIGSYLIELIFLITQPRPVVGSTHPCRESRRTGAYF